MNEDIKTFEAMCDAFYKGTSEVDRTNAQQTILQWTTNIQFTALSRQILDVSENPQALNLAASSLFSLVSKHWTSFNEDERIDMRNYGLQFLGNRGTIVPVYVVASLIKLVTRISKLGWNDGNAYTDLLTSLSPFFKASESHYMIGLRLLKELVCEMDVRGDVFTPAQHRRTAVKFRDHSLYAITNQAMSCLAQVQRGLVSNIDGLKEEALGLLISCLNFDFIGTNPDEGADEVGTIQAPVEWRPLLQSETTLTLIFDIYNESTPPVSAKALEVLVLFCAVRRSVFATENDRTKYRTQLITGSKTILSTNKGLEEPENYHIFCQLLGKIKSNYQLSDLVRTEGYEEWITLAARFTIDSLAQWRLSQNSIHYLLLLWARLVAAVPYCRPGSEGNPMLDQYITKILIAYVDSRLQSVEAAAMDASVDDPLLDLDMVQDELRHMPTLYRYKYESNAVHLITRIDNLLSSYQEGVQVLRNGDARGVQQQLSIIEGQLAWLTNIVGAIISDKSYIAAHMSEGTELFDADLCRRMLQLVSFVDARLSETGGRGLQIDSRLEESFLYFFGNFNRSYIGEQHGMPSTAIALGHSPTMPPLAGGESPPPPSTLKQKSYLAFFERVAMGNHIQVINEIVSKILNNLKYWGNNERIVRQTLELFIELSSGYSSGKLMLQLESVQFILEHHTSESFPFLNIQANEKYRSHYYTALTRLVLIRDEPEVFEAFLNPIISMLTAINQPAVNLRDPNVMRALTGVCRDLRGITSAISSKRFYNQLFELLYPVHLNTIVAAIGYLWDVPRVCTAILRFMSEFVFNKAQRINFDNVSPNGILLFRETSSLLCNYGENINKINDTTGKIKGIRLCLEIMTKALNGNYVNFGVFELYGDTALEKMLSLGLQLALTIPLQDMLNYPKLANTFYVALELLFRGHIPILVRGDKDFFNSLLCAMSVGLDSLDTNMASHSASAMDHLAQYFFDNRRKNNQTMSHLRRHIAETPRMWYDLLATLFNVLLFGEVSTNQWALGRPILSLILASEEKQSLLEYQNYVLANQPPESHHRIIEAFEGLMLNVGRSLEPTNRDKFTSHLTSFRLLMKEALRV